MSIHEKFMHKAIELSQNAINSGRGGPFGAIIVKDNEIISTGQNQVTSLNDPTAHAEIQAIRSACNKLDCFHLPDCTLYCNCEPCPMCLAACYWSHIKTVYYAATQNDAQNIGFDDRHILDEIKKNKDQRKLKIYQLLHDEALSVFKTWATLTKKITY